MLSLESCANCSAMKKELDTLKKSNENFLLLKERIISTDDIIRRYQAKLVESANRTQQISELRKQYDLLKLKCDSAEEQLARFLQTREEMDQARADHESQIKTLNGKIDELEQNISGHLVTIKILHEQLSGKNELLNKSTTFDSKMKIMDNKLKEYGRDKDEALVEAAETRRSLRIAEEKIKKYEKIIRDKGLFEEGLVDEDLFNSDDVRSSATPAQVVSPSLSRKSTETSPKAASINRPTKRPGKKEKVAGVARRGRGRPKQGRTLTAEDWLGGSTSQQEHEEEGAATSPVVKRTSNTFISDSEEEIESTTKISEHSMVSPVVKRTRLLSEDLPPLDQDLLPPDFDDLLSWCAPSTEPAATSTQVPKAPVEPVAKTKPAEKIASPISVQEPVKKPGPAPKPNVLSSLGLFGMSDVSSDESDEEPVKPPTIEPPPVLSKESPRRPLPKHVFSGANKAAAERKESEDSISMPPPLRPEPRHRASAASILRGKAKPQPEKEAASPKPQTSAEKELQTEEVPKPVQILSSSVVEVNTEERVEATANEPSEVEPVGQFSETTETISIETVSSAVAQVEISATETSETVENVSIMSATEKETPTSPIQVASSVRVADTDAESLFSSPRVLAIAEPVEEEKQAEEDSEASSPTGFVIDEPEEVEAEPQVESSTIPAEEGEVEEGEIAEEEEPKTVEEPPKSPQRSLPGAREIFHRSLPMSPLSPIREMSRQVAKRRLSIAEIFESVQIPDLLATFEPEPFKKPSPKFLPPPPKPKPKNVTAKPGIASMGVVRTKGRTVVYGSSAGPKSSTSNID